LCNKGKEERGVSQVAESLRAQCQVALLKSLTEALREMPSFSKFRNSGPSLKKKQTWSSKLPRLSRARHHACPLWKRKNTRG
jgi:hypothetical protein